MEHPKLNECKPGSLITTHCDPMTGRSMQCGDLRPRKFWILLNHLPDHPMRLPYTAYVRLFSLQTQTIHEYNILQEWVTHIVEAK